ncbi:hypothetical protein BV898_17921 [Hypsibius exemplaris]|uniref:Uncharacterized protein n=1 Tax=Hypsibius exemplaris TaxID=2072580 RepID=A0A9X6RMM8_HYPEX|nr:hypothetical protein BV898_17921 [Hypsibius exemplaris]
MIVKFPRPSGSSTTVGAGLTTDHVAAIVVLGGIGAVLLLLIICCCWAYSVKLCKRKKTLEEIPTIANSSHISALGSNINDRAVSNSAGKFSGPPPLYSSLTSSAHKPGDS